MLASKDGKLTVGILAEDPVYPLQPPVKRIINEAVIKLLAAGHRIVQLDAAECQIDGANEIAMEMFRLDASVLPNMIAQGGEPPVPSVAALYGSPQPDRFRHIAGIEKLQGLHRQAFLNLKRHQVKEAWRKIWINNKLDVVLGPGAQNTAVRHDTYGWAPYTCLLNVLEVRFSFLFLPPLFFIHRLTRNSILLSSFHFLVPPNRRNQSISPCQSVPQGQTVGFHCFLSLSVCVSEQSTANR